MFQVCLFSSNSRVDVNVLSVSHKLMCILFILKSKRLVRFTRSQLILPFFPRISIVAEIYSCIWYIHTYICIFNLLFHYFYIFTIITVRSI